MRICYIHIGMNKTGSTAIQRSLYGYEDESVSYCDLAQHNHSLPLITMFGTEPEKFRMHVSRGHSSERVQKKKSKYLKMLDMELKNKTTNTIISGEDLSSTLKEDEIKRLIDYLNPFYSQIKVIGYVRPIQSFAVSAFQERVKGGLSTFHVPAPKYRNRFRAWFNVLGAENVSLVKFDRAHLLEGDVVADFCSRVGITGLETHAGRVNETMSIEAMSVLYSYNKMFGKNVNNGFQTRSFTRMREHMSCIGSSSFSFSKDLMAALLEREAEDIKWLEGQAGFSICDEPKQGDITISSEADLIELSKQQSANVSELMLGLIDESEDADLRQGVLMRAVADLYQTEIRNKK